MAPPAPPASTAVAAAAFYGRTLLVTAALTLQWFVMFAVLAHVVPYVACREELEKERVRKRGGGWGGGERVPARGRGRARGPTPPPPSLFPPTHPPFPVHV